MSESELSDSVPDEATIERELRDLVKNIYKSGELENLTVKRVRIAAEKNLGLEEGFLKESPWKEKSKSIIEAEAESDQNNATTSPLKPVSKASKNTVIPRKPLKRRSPEDESKVEKRQRTDGAQTTGIAVEQKVASRPAKRVLESSGSELSPLESDGTPDDVMEEPNRKARQAKAAVKDDQSESEMSDVVDDGPKPKRKRGSNVKELKATNKLPTQKTQNDKSIAAVDQSDSEMSELIDDDPKPTRKRGSTGRDVKAPKKQKQKTVKSPDLDPDAAEIKRLQGWLIKCGIRKMWGRELKPYETPNAKIKHLKDLLSQAGMTGRYSAEKAAQIREARELQADLEAVQEGAKQWGKAKEEEEQEEEVQNKPRKRLVARGLENLDFLGDDDGEETD